MVVRCLANELRTDKERARWPQVRVPQSYELRIGEIYVVSGLALFKGELAISVFDSLPYRIYPAWIFEVLDSRLDGLEIVLDRKKLGSDYAFELLPPELARSDDLYERLVEWEPEALAFWDQVRKRFQALNAPLGNVIENEGYVESATHYFFARGEASGPVICLGERGAPPLEAKFGWDQVTEIVDAIRGMQITVDPVE